MTIDEVPDRADLDPAQQAAVDAIFRGGIAVVIEQCRVAQETEAAA